MIEILVWFELGVNNIKGEEVVFMIITVIIIIIKKSID